MDYSLLMGVDRASGQLVVGIIDFVRQVLPRLAPAPHRLGPLAINHTSAGDHDACVTRVVRFPTASPAVLWRSLPVKAPGPVEEEEVWTTEWW